MADPQLPNWAPAPAEALAPGRALAPDRSRLGTFLRSPAVVASSGEVTSWWNPAHPGFPYPEAAALWLSWAAWRAARGESAPPDEQLRCVTLWLEHALGTTGTIGKHGRRYLFDTCLAAHGLACVADRVPEARRAYVAALEGVVRFLRVDRPALPIPVGSTRWSDRWLGQQIRGAALLLQAGRLLGDDVAVLMARRIRERADDPEMSPAYTHAVLYGLEGDLLFRGLGEPAGKLSASGTADRLRRLQRPDGSLPAWTDGSGPPRTDATAQSIRLWCAVDRRRFAAAITGACAFLATQQYDDGGLDYGHGRGDRATWVAFFTDQAMAWVDGAVEPERWL